MSDSADNPFLRIYSLVQGELTYQTTDAAGKNLPPAKKIQRLHRILKQIIGAALREIGK